MTTVKVYDEQNDDLRRIRIPSLETVTFQHLLETIFQAFPKLRQEWQGQYLYYYDNEQDKVTVSTTEDIIEADRVMKSMGMTLKLHIGVRKQKQDEAQEATANFEKMLQSLQICLTMWQVDPVYMDLKTNVVALLNDAQGVRALTEIFAMPEYSHTIVSVLQQMSEDGNISKGLIALRSSGQTEELANELLTRYPPSQNVVHQILALSKQHMTIPTAEITKEDAKVPAQTKETPLPNNDFPDLKVLLEIITGTADKSVDDLNMNEAGEVLINLGAGIPIIQPLTLEKRIFLIKEMCSGTNVPTKQEEEHKNVPIEQVQEEQGQDPTSTSTANIDDNTVEESPAPLSNEEPMEEKADPEEQVEQQTDLEEIHAVIGNVEALDTTPISESIENEKMEELNAVFVADITVPDGTSLCPGQYFEKVWLLKNNGTKPWPFGTTLTLVGGDSMSLTENVTLPVVAAQPGDEIRLAINLVAPQESKRYIGYWRLATADGTRFGHRIWVDIVVVPTADALPLPSPPIGDIPKSEPQPIEIPPEVPLIPASAEIPDQANSLYTPQLLELESMGFTDKERNLHLLEQANGNLQQVINHLLG